MSVIGSAEMLVSSRLDPKFAADLKRQVAAAGAKVGAGGIPPVKIAAQLDLKTATSNLQKFGQLQARADNENLARAKKIADAKSRTARQEQADIQRIGNLQSRALRENALFDEKKLGASLQRGGNFFQRFQEKANASLGKVGLSVRSLALATGAGFLAGDILALGLRALIGVVGSAITNFSNLSESVSASSVIFQDGAGTIDKFAASSVKSLGLSARAARETANSIGLLFTAKGTGGADAAQLSTGLVKLAADVASLQNVTGGAEEVAARFAGALAGESEPVRRLGIDTSETALKMLALSEGIITAGQELTAQQKVFVRGIAIIDGAKASYGDFGNTSDQLANSLRISKAAGEEASAALGQALVPSAIRATQIITGLKLVFRDFVEAQTGATGTTRTYWQVLRDGAADAAKGGGAIAVLRTITGLLGVRGAKAEQTAAIEQQNFDEERDRFEELSRIRVEDQAALDKRGEAILGLNGLKIAQRQADLGVAQSALAVRQAEQSLDDLRVQSTRTAHDIIEAELGVTQARLGQQRATLGLQKTILATADILSGVDRQERQLDVTINLTQATIDLVRAQNDQVRSQLALQRTSLDAFDAATRLVRATRAARFNAREVIAANLDLQETQLAGSETALEATIAPLKAQKARLNLDKALRESSRFNEEQTVRESEAGLDLADANLSAQAAALSLESANFRLADAHRATKTIALQLQSAELAVKSAHLGAASAADQQGLAAVALARGQAAAEGKTLDLSAALDIYLKNVGPGVAAFLGDTAIPTTRAYADQLRLAADASARLNSNLSNTPESGGINFDSFTGDAVNGSQVQGLSFNADGATFTFITPNADFNFNDPNAYQVGFGQFGGGQQHGGILPGFAHGGIPGAAHGRQVRQESLIRIGEAGPEILAIRPGHRPEIIPNGGKVESGGRPIAVTVNQVANDPEATAFAVGARLGSMISA